MYLLFTILPYLSFIRQLLGMCLGEASAYHLYFIYKWS